MEHLHLLVERGKAAASDDEESVVGVRGLDEEWSPGVIPEQALLIDVAGCAERRHAVKIERSEVVEPVEVVEVDIARNWLPIHAFVVPVPGWVLLLRCERRVQDGEGRKYVAVQRAEAEEELECDDCVYTDQEGARAREGCSRGAPPGPSHGSDVHSPQSASRHRRRMRVELHHSTSVHVYVRKRADSCLISA